MRRGSEGDAQEAQALLDRATEIAEDCALVSRDGRREEAEGKV